MLDSILELYRTFPNAHRGEETKFRFHQSPKCAIDTQIVRVNMHWTYDGTSAGHDETNIAYIQTPDHVTAKISFYGRLNVW